MFSSEYRTWIKEKHDINLQNCKSSLQKQSFEPTVHCFTGLYFTMIQKVTIDNATLQDKNCDKN